MGLTSSQDSHALSTSFVRHNSLCLSQPRQRRRLSHCFSFFLKAVFAPGTVKLISTPHLRMALVPISSVIIWLSGIYVVGDEVCSARHIDFYIQGASKAAIAQQKTPCFEARSPSEWRGAEGQSLQIGICKSAAGLHESSVALTLGPCFATPQSGKDRAIGVPLPGFSSTSAIQSLCCCHCAPETTRCVA
jgi:hypothetical protein